MLPLTGWSGWDELPILASACFTPQGIQLQRDHLSYRLSRALEVYFYFILVNESYLSYQLPPE